MVKFDATFPRLSSSRRYLSACGADRKRPRTITRVHIARVKSGGISVTAMPRATAKASADHDSKAGWNHPWQGGGNEHTSSAESLVLILLPETGKAPPLRACGLREYSLVSALLHPASGFRSTEPPHRSPARSEPACRSMTGSYPPWTR